MSWSFNEIKKIINFVYMPNFLRDYFSNRELVKKLNIAHQIHTWDKLPSYFKPLFSTTDNQEMPYNLLCLISQNEDDYEDFARKYEFPLSETISLFQKSANIWNILLLGKLKLKWLREYEITTWTQNNIQRTSFYIPRSDYVHYRNFESEQFKISTQDPRFKIVIYRWLDKHNYPIESETNWGNLLDNIRRVKYTDTQIQNQSEYIEFPIIDYTVIQEVAPWNMFVGTSKNNYNIKCKPVIMKSNLFINNQGLFYNRKHMNKTQGIQKELNSLKLRDEFILSVEEDGEPILCVYWQ